MGSLSYIPGINIVGGNLNYIGMCDNSRLKLDIAVYGFEVFGWPDNLCRGNIQWSDVPESLLK